MNIKNISTLFLNNIGLRQTVIKNTFWLGFSEVISRILEFVLIIFIIRVLGVIEFGKFTFALAIASMFLVIFDAGLSDITTRELAHDKNAQKDYNALFSLKVILGAIAFAFIFFISFFVTQDAAIRSVMWTLGIFVLTTEIISFLYCFVRARQKMEFEAWGKILRSFIIISFVFFALFRQPSIGKVSYAYLLANLASLAFILIFFHFNFYSLKLSFDRDIWKKFLAISWPLGLAIVCGSLIVHFDSIMMGYLGQIAENGWYNASRKITSVIVMAATFIFISFYPLISKLFKESKTRLQKAWNYYLESMIILAFPVSLGGFFLAPQIISSAFGRNFGPSVAVFQILIFMVAIIFISYPYNLILIASNQQKKYLWIYVASASANIFLNLILIPRYSLYGAAVSALAAYILLFSLAVEFSRRFAKIAVFNKRLLKVAVLSFLASVAMILMSRFLFLDFNIFINILASSIAYLALMAFFYIFFNLVDREFLLKLNKIIKA
ncbi:MAG: flippase [Patescibacteria group bacterium]